MDRLSDDYRSYSWHQSHDQATVLLLVPYDTIEDDVSVVFERNFLVAGVRGHTPIVKGRLYGNLDVSNSTWQLEPRASRFSARERTTSTTSTASTQSSFAVVSETEISSSFAASVEGHASDFEDGYLSSPALSSPLSLSDDTNGAPVPTAPRRQARFTTSHPVSPQTVNPSLSLASSYSSIESLNAGSGRLLTLHLEKEVGMLWPSLVIGPVPETLSPCNLSSYPWDARTSPNEPQYNMDPTSLVLIALDLCDIRDDKEEAFEYFVRAWHQSHVPSATTRLAAHYLPVTAVPPELRSTTVHTPTSDVSSESAILLSLSPGSTPTNSHMLPPYTDPSLTIPAQPVRGSLSYYLQRIGGAQQLAQLYLEAGLLHLEGTASSLLASSYAGLASLRTPTLSASQQRDGSDVWRRDQELARRYFDRARELHPALDVPLLPPSESDSPESTNHSPVSGDQPAQQQQQQQQPTQLRMPTIDVTESHDLLSEKPVRRRRQGKESSAASAASAVNERVGAGGDDEDNTWYLYLPGLVGAGTALLVVGFLSFSSWRKSQTS